MSARNRYVVVCQEWQDGPPVAIHGTWQTEEAAQRFADRIEANHTFGLIAHVQYMSGKLMKDVVTE